MFSRQEINTLSEVAAMHHRSLPQYLMYANPWFKPGKSHQMELLESIVADHTHMVEQITRLLEDSHEPMAIGEFPLEFTSLHDLSFSFILQRLVEYQARFVARLEELEEPLENGTVAHTVMEEAIGMAIGHLEILRDEVENKGLTAI